MDWAVRRLSVNLARAVLVDCGDESLLGRFQGIMRKEEVAITKVENSL